MSREHQALRLQQLSALCGLPGALPIDGTAATATAATTIAAAAIAAATLAAAAIAAPTFTAAFAATALAAAALAAPTFASAPLRTEADVVHGCCRLELHLGARRRGALVQQHVWQRVPRSEPLAVRAHR